MSPYFNNHHFCRYSTTDKRWGNNSAKTIFNNACILKHAFKSYVIHYAVKDNNSRLIKINFRANFQREKKDVTAQKYLNEKERTKVFHFENLCDFRGRYSWFLYFKTGRCKNMHIM